MINCGFQVRRGTLTRTRTVPVLRADRREAPQAREIDLKSLPLVRLPPAPTHSDSHYKGGSTSTPEAKEPFEVHGAQWHLVSVEQLASCDRPDPAFRRLYPVDSGLLLFDDLGHAQGFGPIQASAIRYDRVGRRAAQVGFAHDIYRLGVHPLGRGFITMSADCVVHAYDENLKLLFESELAAAPQLRPLRDHFGIGDPYLKHHIRCVALAPDQHRYLFTVVDEAWCVAHGGERLWGVKLPLKEGWKRVATPSKRYDTGLQIQEALALMNLSLPLRSEQVRRRYWELARSWHPDHNHGSLEAHRKMQALNLAAELLAGVDLRKRARSCEQRRAVATSFELDGFAIEFDFDELFASDWIYAASFAAQANAVYLASYGGRVVVVDDNGVGLRVYDLGGVPQAIVDTGDYLYILTHTRLYVLRADSLRALIDMPEGGNLVVAKRGFGLLETKRWRWFSPEGVLQGSVLSRGPIRRVYCSADSVVMETRQRRALIGGALGWWE
jgi:hypothetical protein